MAIPATTAKSEGRQVRIELLRRGWTVGDLARASGLQPEFITNILGGSRSSQAAREKINAALGLPLLSVFPVAAPRRKISTSR